MKTIKTEQSEIYFLNLFPQGFKDPYYLELNKKYDDSKIVEMFNDYFTVENLSKCLELGTYNEVIKYVVRAVSKSMMISVFEKTAFRNFMAIQSIQEEFLWALLALVKDYNCSTFTNFSNVLAQGKTYNERAHVNKWPIISFFCYYLHDKCYPVKPTTVKKVASGLKFELNYKPKINYDTYQEINQMYENFRKESHVCETRTETHALLYTVWNSA